MAELWEEYPESDYDDFLDEIHEVVKIGSLEYSVSYVLKNVDPIAYREGYNDWVDMRETDKEEEENEDDEIEEVPDSDIPVLPT